MSVKPTNIPTYHLRKSADSAGNFSRHGKLGEVTGNIRTFVLPYENGPYTFDMKFVYDSWNRIDSMFYPDGEVVVYGYNSGGMLSSMTGAKNGLPYKYIDSIRYNEFELKAAMYYGNGTKTFYKYDTLQRLSNLYSQTSANEPMQNIGYTYDSVSNIINITNYASTLLNGLGGKYGNTYMYNNLYRLVYSEGTWYGIHPVGYELDMEYTPNGRIVKKYLEADTYTQTTISSNQIPVIYQNDYHYTNNSQPNTLSRVENSMQMFFEWDVKGNMTRHILPNGFGRHLCWDEQNRLQGVKDDMQRLSYYQYDANGDRVYKLTGDPVRQNRNGEWRYSYLMNRPTLYASPYVVTNSKGYTKHYYAESERIASRIGGGGLLEIDMNDSLELLASHKERSINLFAEVMECLDAQAVVETSPLQFLYSWKQVVYPETDCYWYHPDHLGSSSWITYTDGSAVEHLHYMPWGEDFVRQRSTDWHARFTFSAKEKDQETGFSYFGSRYYSSDLSIRLSVDPMSDKYPSLSPYAYCANNPIKLVDPNGEEMTKFEDSNGNVIKQIDDGSNAVFRQVGTGRGLHYEFSGFDESQGGVNEVNLGTAIQEQQQLNMDNSELQQSADGTTYCNYATQNVMKTVSSVPDYGNALLSGNANTMCDKMENSANYVSVSKTQAIKYGKNGLAIVAYKNSNGGHGHVATFSAGKNEGEVANIGPKKYTGFKNVNQVINSNKSKTYYIFIRGHVSNPVNIK